MFQHTSMTFSQPGSYESVRGDLSSRGENVRNPWCPGPVSHQPPIVSLARLRGPWSLFGGVRNVQIYGGVVVEGRGAWSSGLGLRVARPPPSLCRRTAHSRRLRHCYITRVVLGLPKRSWPRSLDKSGYTVRRNNRRRLTSHRLKGINLIGDDTIDWSYTRGMVNLRRYSVLYVLRWYLAWN